VKLAAERSTNEGDGGGGGGGRAACPLALALGEAGGGGGGGGGGRRGGGVAGEGGVAEARALPELPSPPPRNALFLDRRVAPRSGTAAPADAQSASFFPVVCISPFFCPLEREKKAGGLG